MKYIPLIFCFSSFLGSSQVYNFNCDDVGYETYSGGGTFVNVDESGVDLTIEGMAYDFCNGVSIVTGINNGVNEGVVHTYTFTFSEPVDVNFSISDINVDLELPCYYDFLAFSDEPIFTDPYNVSIEGDTIIPIIANVMPAYAIVNYENITSFTIQHGDGGTSCNPGILYFSNMKFTPLHSSVSTVEFSQNSSFIVNSVVQDQLILRGDVGIISELGIFDIMGRKMDVSHTLGEDVLIDVAHLPNGHYFLWFEENNEVKVERFIVSH